MTDWKITMLLMLPLMVAWHRAGWGERLLTARIRTWAAMFAASLAALAVRHWQLPEAAAYIAIDAIAGAVVLRRPAGVAQRAIGLLFAMMVLFHVGFWLANNPGSASGYFNMQVGVGWIQFACLLAWGADDVFGRAFRGAGVARRAVSSRRGNQ